MFTGVVQHRQIHIPPAAHTALDRFDYPEFEISSSPDILSPPKGCQDNNVSPLKTDWQHLQAPQIYPRPLHSPPLESDRPPSRTDQRSPVQEHMLRRKTPNGTLAAGYDGTSVGWTTKPHASKHFLMPLLDDRVGITPGERGREHSQSARNGNTHQGDLDAGYQTWDGSADPLCGAHPQGRFFDTSDKNILRRRQFPQAPGLDSVLHQITLPQDASNLGGHQQIPTVLQPMWPPYIGPTASNELGPFGPYWPNGAYVPYRPAAMRNPRYRMQNMGSRREKPDRPNQKDQALGFQSDPKSLESTTNVSDCSWRGSPARNNSLFSHDIKPFELEEHDPARTMHQDVRSGIDMQHANSLSFRERTFLQNYDDIEATQHRTWNDVHPSTFSLDRSPPLLSHHNTATQSNLQFKEKVLVWAHRIYVDLLASLHQARKLSHANQNPLDRHNNQTNIYPQPPRHPLTNLASTNIVTRLDAQRRSQHHHSQIKGFSHDDYSPQRMPMSLDSRLEVNRSLSHFQGMETLSSNAVSGLDMLGRLCQESGWTWTDGLLLGGCLAYGLGDFVKAMQWYSQVLICDANNVEALSNMAATLLSLGRRKDAEQYWLRSVKLRPSYFEAVEHLVGLLCGDQRGREAVKVIEFVEQALCYTSDLTPIRHAGLAGDDNDNYGKSRTAFTPTDPTERDNLAQPFIPPFGDSSGYAIPRSDNGRMLALVHAKGNMLYALGDNGGAANAFEDAILIAAGRRSYGVQDLIQRIIDAFDDQCSSIARDQSHHSMSNEAVLLLPEIALKTAQIVFPLDGQLPGLFEVPHGIAKRAAVSTTSNSLLSLAKIYQDGMSSSGATNNGPKATSGVQDILALYYLSLSLQPSPSTANNVGILLASIQQTSPPRGVPGSLGTKTPPIPGVVPGSGIAMALAYYNYGLNLDSRHAHLYTNLGSLLKDIGQLNAAIKMYEQAVACDGNFDIALANLANAVKDQGRISDAIGFYRRAVSSNPDFAEAVCGLANALNSVCCWKGRGGIISRSFGQDRWHVDEHGMLLDARRNPSVSSGWTARVVSIVEKQLNDGRNWGFGVLPYMRAHHLDRDCRLAEGWTNRDRGKEDAMAYTLDSWAEQSWEGAKVIRLVERITKRLVWRMYHDRLDTSKLHVRLRYPRPQLPSNLSVPSAPTVLPFHTFTCPLTAKQIRKISQRNGLRISCSTLRAPWLPASIYQPPAPPAPYLKVGYVSSDFNNHPLAHLMQSVFGFHDPARVKAICYATTASDSSIHRDQIEREAPQFHDASAWSIDRLVNQIVDDGVHILINLNGYTRGARNEVFAARPAPIQMSFMGFAGTLGAEWCDYLLADTTTIPPRTLRPWRRNVDITDQIQDANNSDDEDEWVYGENIIFARDTFFCCDHRQSAPDAKEPDLNWSDEQRRRWRMRKELFPDLPDDTVILGNFNQLYKIEPTTFRTWLRILSRSPKAILWLLRFPDLGENNLRETALLWAGAEVASRIIFTDVAPKHQHISRARICDLFLDTPECNAHTTAADVLWSGTPLLTFPRYEYKMCSRMAASILQGALPKDTRGQQATEHLIAYSDLDYEEKAVQLATGLHYSLRHDRQGLGHGKLTDIRQLLYQSRWTSALFDTRRWVRDLEDAYGEAWKRWVEGIGGDIWL